MRACRRACCAAAPPAAACRRRAFLHHDAVACAVFYRHRAYTPPAFSAVVLFCRACTAAGCSHVADFSSRLLLPALLPVTDTYLPPLRFLDFLTAPDWMPFCWRGFSCALRHTANSRLDCLPCRLYFSWVFWVACCLAPHLAPAGLCCRSCLLFCQFLDSFLDTMVSAARITCRFLLGASGFLARPPLPPPLPPPPASPIRYILPYSTAEKYLDFSRQQHIWSLLLLC